MDSPAPPSDQVRHTQVCGGEIPVLQHLQHLKQSPSKGVKTRPFKGVKNTHKNVSLNKCWHKADSIHAPKVPKVIGNIWQDLESCPHPRSSELRPEQSALPTTRKSETTGQKRSSDTQPKHTGAKKIATGKTDNTKQTQQVSKQSRMCRTLTSHNLACTKILSARPHSSPPTTCALPLTRGWWL